MKAPEHSLRDTLAAALKELNEGRIEIAERMSVELLRSRPDRSRDPPAGRDRRIASRTIFRGRAVVPFMSCSASRPCAGDGDSWASGARARRYCRGARLVRSGERGGARSTGAGLSFVCDATRMRRSGGAGDARRHHAKFSARRGGLESNRRGASQGQSIRGRGASVRARLVLQATLPTPSSKARSL